jgi:hypothetical protein
MVPALKTPVFAALRNALLLTFSASTFQACQVAPPASSATARFGVVRAADSAEAKRVATLLDQLAPRVVSLVPDTRTQELEVWVQESPALYRFSTSSYSDADGFWAEDRGRIHLRASAENIERTLAHELVHASLGRSWRTLPGTLEEGLCDVVSARLCTSGATHMRGGRLLSAAFATGGLVLELEVIVPAEVHPLGIRTAFNTRVRLEGDPPLELDPLEVFHLKAGLSSATLTTEVKKACYGLSYLVVERIVDRRGFTGLHELCRRARAEGRSEVPQEWLLEAAELTPELRSWREAVAVSLGSAELEELVRTHPEFLVQALSGFFAHWTDRDALETALPAIHARLGLPGRAGIELFGLSEVRSGLAEAWVAAATGISPP